jgi:hypothetical protein
LCGGGAAVEDSEFSIADQQARRIAALFGLDNDFSSLKGQLTFACVGRASVGERRENKI